jgi:hypothetical protein
MIAFIIHYRIHHTFDLPRLLSSHCHSSLLFTTYLFTFSFCSLFGRHHSKVVSSCYREPPSVPGDNLSESLENTFSSSSPSTAAVLLRAADIQSCSHPLLLLLLYIFFFSLNPAFFVFVECASCVCRNCYPARLALSCPRHQVAASSRRPVLIGLRLCCCCLTARHYLMHTWNIGTGPAFIPPPTHPITCSAPTSTFA